MMRSQLNQLPLLSTSNQGMMMVQPQPSLCQNSTLMTLLEGPLYYPWRHWGEAKAKVTRNVVEDIEQADGERVQNLSFILGVGNGKLEEIISYKQLVDHLEAAALKPTDPNWKGCKYNVLVDWETGEKTYEPLSVLAADDPVTCSMYAKENDLLHIDRRERFRNLSKRDKILTRAIMQSRIRQARRAKKYMFGYLITRSYKEELECDKENNNTKWADATSEELDCIKEQQVFTKHQRVQLDSNNKQIINAPPNQQMIRENLIFAVNHDGRHKARLVADGSLTPEPVENIKTPKGCLLR